jgi:hypothetical protein
MHIADFLRKVKWEGGVFGALEDGLTSQGYNLPEQMKASWDRMSVLYEELRVVSDAWSAEYGD